MTPMPKLEYALRSAGVGDEEALALVGAASFLEAFAGILQGPNILAHCRKQHSAEKYRAWLQSKQAHVCLAEVAGAPVGYAVLCPPDLPIDLRPDDLELKRIYLLHRFQGRGIGAALMNWSIAKAQALRWRRLLLGVYAGNEGALEFYTRSGFEKVGTRSFQVGEQICEDLILARGLQTG